MDRASPQLSSEPHSAALSTILIGLALAGLGFFVGYEAASMEVSSSYARVGPRVFPMFVAGGLVAIGLLLTLQALRGRWKAVLTDRVPGERIDSWRQHPGWRIALVGAGLILDVLLMRPLGFIVASAVLFTCATQAFGSRRLLLDLAIGLAMGAIIFFFFNAVLGVRLPTGWLWT